MLTPHPTRYRLRDRELLRTIMDSPGRGTPYTIRTLATAANCSSGTISHLLTGKRDTALREHALGIKEALGVAVRVLFIPPLSQSSDEPSRIPYTTKETTT
jgi:hypothetical protein